MKQFIKIHQEWFLTGIAILLLGILVAVFVWGITGLAIDLTKAILPQSNKGSISNFDLEAAKRLNLKGLAQ